MLKNFTLVAVSIMATATASAAQLPEFKMQGPPPPIQEEPSITTKTATKEVVPEKPKEKRLICKGCSSQESIALEFFQEQGIKDRNALATIMGNIKQESTFVPNICEGGNKTSYYNCGRGYGLIQFTTASRYYGLGNFAQKIGGNPSTLNTQLRYITTEPQWKSIENKMKTPGKSISRYMDYAYDWISWGTHGARTSYAHDYASRLISV